MGSHAVSTSSLFSHGVSPWLLFWQLLPVAWHASDNTCPWCRQPRSRFCQAVSGNTSIQFSLDDHFTWFATFVAVPTLSTILVVDNMDPCSATFAFHFFPPVSFSKVCVPPLLIEDRTTFTAIIAANDFIKCVRVCDFLIASVASHHSPLCLSVSYSTIRAWNK